MNLWQRYEKNRKDALPSQGISLHFEKGIEPEFRKDCIHFVRWLRKKYTFPVHANIYIKDCEKVRLADGSYAYGGFRWFNDDRPPYIRIPARIAGDWVSEDDPIGNYYSILGSLVHELTHYFQWIDKTELTERQANFFRFRIIDLYCEENNLFEE